MNNPIIETDISVILKELQSGQKEILKEVSDVKVSLETVKGDIKALDTKVEQLDKRIANQEFLNRGVFIGLLLALLGGLINWLGWMPKH
jgi:predicted  nucleic acid-binding Zn-ribbon protein